MAITRALRRILGSWERVTQLLNSERSHFRAVGPRCLICSVRVSSRPAALPFFRQSIAAWSSSSVNCHVDSVSPRRLVTLLWRVLCGGFPFRSSWWATWSAVTLECSGPFWGHCWSFWWLTRLAYCCESYQHSQWGLARISFGLLRLLPWASPLHSWTNFELQFQFITPN